MNGKELLASTNEIGFLTDRDGVIKAWNEAAEEAFDMAAAEVIGKPCWEVLKGRDSFDNEYCCPKCPLSRLALQSRRVRRCQLSFCDANGVLRPYSVLILLLRGSGPVDPAVVHLLHPAVWDRRSSSQEALQYSANRQRGALTPRELEVLSLLGEGCSTAAVAQGLCISRATASNHIQHVLHKLNVHTRLEAVLLARKLELI